MTTSAPPSASCGTWPGWRPNPAGAAAYAALVSGAYRPAPGERVVAVVCGSNVDPTTLT